MFLLAYIFRKIEVIHYIDITYPRMDHPGRFLLPVSSDLQRTSLLAHKSFENSNSCPHIVVFLLLYQFYHISLSLHSLHRNWSLMCIETSYSSLTMKTLRDENIVSSENCFDERNIFIEIKVIKIIVIKVYLNIS